MDRILKPGDRVRLSGHWEFADGITGTIRQPSDFIVQMNPPGEWQGCRRVLDLPTGRSAYYWVQFDEAQDDGSGDGPYRGAEIDATALVPVDDEGPS